MSEVIITLSYSCISEISKDKVLEIDFSWKLYFFFLHAFSFYFRGSGA